jgi:hypothetical protein
MTEHAVNRVDTSPDEATALRVLVYEWIMKHGVPPTTAEIGTALSISPASARLALAGLKIGKTVLPDPRTGEVWMAGPFSAAPTPYRVIGSRTSWWANCAWDMLGVAVLANEPVRIEASCADCGEPMILHADPRAKSSDVAVVHFLVPARRWYDDIGFT